MTAAKDSSLEKNDPRRWLVADKETLKRRLSLLEAKNEVKALANKFRKENGLSANPREIVAAMAESARLERGDEDARQIIKEYIAQGSGKRLPTRSTVSHESFVANRENSGESTHENCFKNTSSAENCSIDQLRRSQRKFFMRPRSRTQESKPASPTRNDIPLLTFKETVFRENSDKGKESKHKDQASNPPAFALNSVPGKIMKAPILRKGILKRSSAELLHWRSSSSMETSLCALENLRSSDEENSSAAGSSKEESDRIPKQKSKFRAGSFSKDQKKDDVRILLATPESSEIVEDSPKLHRAAIRMNATGKDSFTKIEIKDELDFFAPEKNCVCQQQEASSTAECSSAGQGVESSAGSFPPIPLVIEPDGMTP